MTIALSGLSHHTSPIALRERLAIPGERIPAALHRLKQRLPAGGGAVILSTCNRVEFYVRADAPADALFRAVRAFIGEWHETQENTFAESLYEYSDRDAAAHLFRVAASLDSLVVGEDQILGQAHEAYLTAHAENAADKILGAMFQRAFKAAKEVRTKTNIGTGKVSVASVAVELAVSIFTSLADKTVMVVGSGDTGQLALKSLAEKGVGNVIVVNRTLERAAELAESFGGEALALSALAHHLHRADILIACTSSPEHLLRFDDFQRALKARNKAPMFVIDIGLPRDIDPAAGSLDNIYLYDIDDLQEVADKNLEARRAELARCHEIVDEHVNRFMEWRRGLHAEPAIVSMAQELHAIRERELAKTLESLRGLSEEQRAEIEYLSKRIVNSILQRPVTQLKIEAAADESLGAISLVKRLFGLEDRR